MHVALAHEIEALSFPVPEKFVSAAEWMVGKFYDPERIEAALAHLARFHTAECNPWIYPGDRPAIEALLPLDTFAWNDLTWDLSMWELGPDEDSEVASPAFIPY